MRHKWKYISSKKTVCKTCGAIKTWADKKSSRSAFGFAVFEVVTLKDGTSVELRGKTKMPGCEP